MSLNDDLRYEWLSLPELARFFGKSYENIKQLHRHGALAGCGYYFYNTGPKGKGGRVWVRITHYRDVGR